MGCYSVALLLIFILCVIVLAQITSPRFVCQLGGIVFVWVLIGTCMHASSRHCAIQGGSEEHDRMQRLRVIIKDNEKKTYLSDARIEELKGELDELEQIHGPLQVETIKVPREKDAPYINIPFISDLIGMFKGGPSFGDVSEVKKINGAYGAIKDIVYSDGYIYTIGFNKRDERGSGLKALVMKISPDDMKILKTYTFGGSVNRSDFLKMSIAVGKKKVVVFSSNEQVSDGTTSEVHILDKTNLSLYKLVSVSLEGYRPYGMDINGASVFVLYKYAKGYDVILQLCEYDVSGEIVGSWKYKEEPVNYIETDWDCNFYVNEDRRIYFATKNKLTSVKLTDDKIASDSEYNKMSVTHFRTFNIPGEMKCVTNVSKIGNDVFITGPTCIRTQKNACTSGVTVIYSDESNSFTKVDSIHHKHDVTSITHVSEKEMYAIDPSGYVYHYNKH
jgi:hypothetical protein